MDPGSDHAEALCVVREPWGLDGVRLEPQEARDFADLESASAPRAGGDQLAHMLGATLTHLCAVWNADERRGPDAVHRQHAPSSLPLLRLRRV
eukprot:3931627-Rhodomonas_salina.1